MRGLWAGILVLIALADIARAQTDRCSAITDPAWRKACEAGSYDPTISRTAGTPAGRADYAASLRRTFLAQGFEMDVAAIEGRPKNRQKDRAPVDKYPQLHLFGLLTNPIVFQAITSGRVLQSAKDLGFQSVEFYSNTGQGGWWFDLSGATLPDCDVAKRVCR